MTAEQEKKLDAIISKVDRLLKVESKLDSLIKMVAALTRKEMVQDARAGKGEKRIQKLENRVTAIENKMKKKVA